ncbi:unnamed protein product [Paramecium octaurelia]|uniref:Uncharacterized protein n=1 Tax=Paramecium octaurelia TaxID=43137 RepID=A0A8S1UHN3_PAROT|nr:unnamed protein product [Paramecium octaurelia]
MMGNQYHVKNVIFSFQIAYNNLTYVYHVHKQEKQKQIVNVNKDTMKLGYRFVQNNSNCMTCLNTSNNCTSCDSNQFREINLKTRTFDGTCQQCNQKCQTSALFNYECTSCIKYRYLKDKDCVCIYEMYESYKDKSCILCSKIYLTCVNQSDYCLTCSIANFRQFKTANTCECIQGYQENPINLNCEQCANSCLTWSLLYDNCLTCNTSLNLFLVNKRCLCSNRIILIHQIILANTNIVQFQINTIQIHHQNIGLSIGKKQLSMKKLIKLFKQQYIQHNAICENTNKYCITSANEFKRQFRANNCLCIHANMKLELKCVKNTLIFAKHVNLLPRIVYPAMKLNIIVFIEKINVYVSLECSNKCLICKGQANLCIVTFLISIYV